MKNDILSALYREIVLELSLGDLYKLAPSEARSLSKSESTDPNATHRNPLANEQEKIRSKYESVINDIIITWMKSLHDSKLKKSEDDSNDEDLSLESIALSIPEDFTLGSLLSFLKSKMKALIDRFNPTSKIVKALQPMIKEVVELQEKEYPSMSINYNLVDERATEFLETQIGNDFSKLSDASAEGIYKAVAEEMKSDDGYSLKSIAEKILSSEFSPAVDGKVHFEKTTLDAGYWAKLVSGNATSKASTESIKQIGNSAGLKLLEWHTNNNPCDECLEFDNQIFTEDELPDNPVHPNCRCIISLVKAEIQAIVDDSAGAEQSEDNNSNDDNQDQSE